MTSFLVDVLGRPVLVRGREGLPVDEGLAGDLGFPPRGTGSPALTLDLAREDPWAFVPEASLRPDEEVWRPLNRALALVRVAQFVPGGPDPVALVERLNLLLELVPLGEVLFRRHGDVASLLRWQELTR